MASRRNPDAAAWLRLVAPAAAAVVVALLPPLADLRWAAPQLLFWAIAFLATGCAVGAAVVIAVGWRRRLAEVTLLGGLLMATSLLPLAHGLTTPGVVYGENPATMVAAFVAVPAGLFAGLPLLLPGRLALAVHWRAWTLTSVALVVAACAALLTWPGAIPAPQAGSPVALAAVGLSLAGTGVLAMRHLRLYRIGRRSASLAASAGFSYLGLSTLVWLGAAPWSPAFWLAHVADVLGVIGAIIGLVLAHRRDLSLTATLAPVVNRDPLVALELGLAPAIHAFIAALDARDQVTRDHVVRVGEMVMRVGARAGLDGTTLRALGLGGLLHDIGKLSTPQAILAKPGMLDDGELVVMRDHAAQGAALLAADPLLAPVAPLVRSHHERIDGGGYPDGLAGEEIPRGARIIAACDAWDAMTSDRPYRRGMGHSEARAILEAEAAHHWGPDVVGLLLAELDANGPILSPVYELLGRPAGDLDHDHCLDALPASVRVLLAPTAGPA